MVRGTKPPVTHLHLQPRLEQVALTGALTLTIIGAFRLRRCSCLLSFRWGLGRYCEGAILWAEVLIGCDGRRDWRPYVGCCHCRIVMGSDPDTRWGGALAMTPTRLTEQMSGNQHEPRSGGHIPNPGASVGSQSTILGPGASVARTALRSGVQEHAWALRFVAPLCNGDLGVQERMHGGPGI